MSARFVICFVFAIGMSLSSQSDAQIFRRWGPAIGPQQAQSVQQRFSFPNAAAALQQRLAPLQRLAPQQQQFSGQQQQFLPQQQFSISPQQQQFAPRTPQTTVQYTVQQTTQYVRPQCEQERQLQQLRLQQQQQQRVVYVPAEQLRQQISLERQIRNAQSEIARRQQVVSQLQASMFQQNNNTRISSGFGINNLTTGIYQSPVVSSQAQTGVLNQSALSQPYVSGQIVSALPTQSGVVDSVNQFDIARDLTASPTLDGPSLVSNDADSVQLIEPADESATGTLKETALVDSEVIPVSATSDDDPSSGVSILQDAVESNGNSILDDAIETTTEEIGGIELNGPTGK